MTEIVSVVAGVLRDGEGKVLAATRPRGKSFAGFWEFPGGKIEAGESEFEALRRELKEEIGVRILCARPWLRRRVKRGDALISLTFFRIAGDEWEGVPTPREGQILAWRHPECFDLAPILPGNDVVLRALAMPESLAGDNGGIENRAPADGLESSESLGIQGIIDRREAKGTT